MSVQDEPQSTLASWDEETLVDKLDVSVQLIQVVDDVLQLKVQAGEGLSKDEAARLATILGYYIRDYEKARSEWIRVVS
jgi:hypothetical protein